MFKVVFSGICAQLSSERAACRAYPRGPDVPGTDVFRCLKFESLSKPTQYSELIPSKRRKLTTSVGAIQSCQIRQM